MRGIKSSKGYTRFIGYAPGYSQNYKKGKITIVLETERVLTAGDIQSRELFEVSVRLARRLANEE